MILNNQKKYSLSKKISNIVIVFAIFAIAISYFAIIPSILTIGDLKIAIINEKINTEKKYQNKKNAIEVENKISQIEPDITSLDDVFINKNRELEFITILENIANKNNINQKINLTPPTTSTETKTSKTNKNKKSAEKTEEISIPSSPLNIVASGRFENIINYIQEINSLKYYINISGLDFSKTSEIINDEINLQSKQVITLNISAKTYWK